MVRSFLALPCLLLAIASPAAAAERVDLRLDTSQAEAVLAILEARGSGKAVSEEAWRRLFESEPYLRLEKREASLGREFGRDSFREFALSPEQVSKRAALERTLTQWKRADLAAAARRVLPYLPADATLRATVYPVIKPRTNSFVFEVDTNPAIFLYLDPKMGEAEFSNTVAHELHHIGLGSVSAAYEAKLATLPPPARQAAQWMGAFGEGLAVLAAAGSAEGHPLAVYPVEDQTRWDRDQEFFDQLLGQLDRFFVDIIDGGFAKPETADHVAFTFFGYRGPWYTVGYRMGALIERRLGRAALLEGMTDPRRLLARYNEAATLHEAAGGPPLPRWSARLLAAVGKPPPP